MREQRRVDVDGGLVAAALSLACAGLASGHGSHSLKPVAPTSTRDPDLERVVARRPVSGG